MANISITILESETLVNPLSQEAGEGKYEKL